MENSTYNSSDNEFFNQWSNKYNEIASCNNSSFSLGNDGREKKDFTPLIEINSGKEGTITNGNGEMIQFHPFLFENFSDFLLPHKKFDDYNKIEISTGNLIFNKNLLKIIIEYFYTKKINKIENKEIFNLLEIVYLLQNIYIIEKIFEYLKKIKKDVKPNDSLNFHREIFQNLSKFYLYSQSEFNENIDEKFKDEFEKKFEDIFQVIINYYFSSSSYSEQEFLNCFSNKFFEENNHYINNFKKFFEIILRKLIAIKTVTKTFILKLVDHYIKNMPFNEEERKEYLRDCYLEKIIIKDISLNDYEMFIDKHELFDEIGELRNKNEIINNSYKRICQERDDILKKFKGGLQTQPQPQPQPQIVIQQEKNKFIFPKGDQLNLLKNSLIIQSMSDKWGIVLLNKVLIEGSSTWKFIISQTDESIPFPENFIFGIHFKPNETNANPLFDNALCGLSVPFQSGNPKYFMLGRPTNDNSKTISTQNNDSFSVTFNANEKTLSITNNSQNWSYVLNNIPENKIFFPYFAIRNFKIEYLP